MSGMTNRGSRSIACYALLLWALAMPACAGEQRVTLGSVAAVAWTPGEAASLALPLVVFSHGSHGCATQSRFLMRAIADAGYIVVAPNHRDATCDETGAPRPGASAEAPIARPELWSPETYRGRADDIRKAIDALRQDPAWTRRIDWRHLALAGHSLGGYTVLGLAGAWPAWRLAGVSAVLALSPYTRPFLLHRTLPDLNAPVMYQGGTRDIGLTPVVAQSGGAYALSPPPKYFVEFTDAGHLAWTDRSDEARAGIVAYAVAFLDRHVKGAPAAPVLTEVSADVARLLYDLGDGSPGNF